MTENRNTGWTPSPDGSISFGPQRTDKKTMTNIDTHGATHRERTAAELASRLSVLRRSDPEAAIVATDLERLATAQLARDDLDDTARTFWSAALKTATGSATPLPTPPVAEEVTRYFARPRALNILNGDERQELAEQATGVTPREAEEALQLLELSEASEDGSLTFGLSDAERAAALVLRDDRLTRGHLVRLTAELAEDRTN